MAKFSVRFLIYVVISCTTKDKLQTVRDIFRSLKKIVDIELKNLCSQNNLVSFWGPHMYVINKHFLYFNVSIV